MRINLQKFAFSTLTFSLATTLAVAAFSESANAQRNPSGSYGTSVNLPALNFDVFLVDDNGKTITDAEDDGNLGVFKNAIEIIDDDNDLLTNVFTVEPAEVNGNIFDGLLNGRALANFSAELTESDEKKFITYQIFRDNDDQLDDDDYKNPDQFLKFAPVDVSSRSESDIKNLVNNLGFILDDGKEGKYDVILPNDLEPSQIGVLGRAIDLSLNFQAEDLFKNEEDKEDPELIKKAKGRDDFLQIKKFAPPKPSTSIPEPTTTLASIFALGFAGKFLRKSKKDNA